MLIIKGVIENEVIKINHAFHSSNKHFQNHPFHNVIHRKNCVSLNSVQEFIEIEAWLPLTFLVCLHNQSIHYPLSHIKDYRCLKKAIHQIDSKMNGCSFQQVLRQNLSWFLS